MVLFHFRVVSRSQCRSLLSQLNNNKQNKLYFPIVRYNVADWNNAVSPGWYTGENALNAPGTGYCTGLVLPHNGDANYPVQLVFKFNALTIYIRAKTSDQNWTNWRYLEPSS